MPADRRWSDADRELVAQTLWREWRSSGEPNPADQPPTQCRTDAEAVLDALTAAGKLADPAHDARVRARVAEEIAADVGAWQATGISPRTAAAIARQHATPPTTEEDHCGV